MVIYIMPMFRQAPLYLFLCHAKALGDANQLQPTPIPWNLPVLQLILAKHPILLFGLLYAMVMQLTSSAQHPSSDIPKIPVRQGVIVQNPNG